MYDNHVGLLKSFYIPRMPEKTSYERLGQELPVPFECYLAVFDSFQELEALGFGRWTAEQNSWFITQSLRAITIASEDTSAFVDNYEHPSDEFCTEVNDSILKSQIALDIKVQKFMTGPFTRIEQVADFTSEVLGHICLYCHIANFYMNKEGKTPAQVEAMSKQLLDFLRAHMVRKTLFMQLNTSEYLQ